MATISTTARPAYVYDAGGDQWVPIAWTVLGSGAASAPALTFTGDSNTGLWSPAADTVAFSTGGSERLRIDSSGNVGIGTSSPGATLDIGIGYPQLSSSGTARSKWYADATDTHLTAEGGRALSLDTNGAQRMRIDSAGNVGIGTISPNSDLNIYDATVPTININNSTSGTTASDGLTITLFGNDAYLNNRESGSMLFYTANTERMRITSAGNVGIGTSSPAAALHVSGSSPVIQSSSAATASSSGYIYLTKARGSIASPTVVSSGDNINGIYFAAYDGSAYQNAAAITALVDTTPGSGDMPGRLSFNTTADGGTTQYERLRIDNAGLITGTGTSLGAWTSYTPTLGGTGWAIGNGTITVAKYAQIGKMVHVRVFITWGSTSTFGSGALNFTLPVAAKDTSTNVVPGSCRLFDESLSAEYFGVGMVVDGVYYPKTLGASGAGANVTTSNPFAWASGDQLQFALIYEAA